MILRGRILALPKRGNSADEFEDAYAPREVGEAIALPFSCAVADGATESSFSNVWARLLAAEFVDCEGNLEAMEAEMPRLRALWREHVSSKPLPWYAEQKLEQGAFSTVLGVSIEQADEGNSARWHAFAVGDSCLFHAKADGQVVSFPAERSEELRAWPYLVPSRQLDEEPLHSIGRSRRGILEPGDRLILVTDAVAGWILKSLEEGGSPLELLNHATQTMPAFLAWVEGLRDAGGIKNDDCTLLWLECCEEPR